MRPALSLIGFAFILLLASCSSVPPHPGDRMEQVAMEAALKEGLKVREFTRQCAAASMKAGEAAKEFESAWWEVNGDLVQAANEAYSSKFSIDVIDPYQAYALPVLRLLYDGEKAGFLMVNDRPRSYAQKERTCVNTSKRLMQDEMDLRLDKRYEKIFPAWSYLVYTYKDRQTPLDKIPSVAGEVELRDDAGRYLYQAQKVAYSGECNSAAIAVINREGSSEYYGVFCENGTSQLVHCDWGECSVQK